MKSLLLSLSFLFLHFYMYAQPQGNRGLYFDGVDDFATIPSFGILSNATIELWIKPSAPSNGSIISNMGSNDSEFGYSIDFNSSTRKIVISLGRDGNRSLLISNATLNLKQWYHIAYTFDGTTMRLYIDGTLDSSLGASQLPNNGTIPFRMGEFNSFRYTGQVDELRIFNIVRTQPEIASDRTNPTGTGISAEVGFWQFEQGTGQSITNTGFNGATNNGTLGVTISPESADPLWALRVKNTADSSLESLRDVITNANLGTLPGTNYIDFSIQQANPATVSTIILLSPLPLIDDSVIMDAYSAFGSLPNSTPFGGANNAQIRVEINASGIGSPSFPTPLNSALVLNNTNNSIIKGFSIFSVPDAWGSQMAIDIRGTSQNNTIEGCYIGLFANGATAPVNMNGVAISGTNNVLGWSGTIDPKKFNVISNTIYQGIVLLGNNNIVQGNYIGTNILGTLAVANGSRGIVATDGSINAQILNNVISGNGVAGGVYIQNGANNTSVKGNYIGTRADGTGSIPNTGAGVFITGNIDNPVNNSIIGGTGGDANIIANNLGAGVLAENGTFGTSGNRISRNKIFNNGIGISLVDGANNNKQAPTITSATPTTITGTCTSCAAGEIVEVFDNPPGEDQGRTFLGTATTT